MGNLRRISMAALVAGAGIVATPNADAGGLSIHPTELGVSVTNASCEVDKTCVVRVSVTVPSGYKCNKDYPNKIKNISAGDDAEAPASVKGECSGSTVSYQIPVTPKEAGDHSVSGEIRFGYCDDSECKTDSSALSAKVTGR